jgi:PAS domain S-box-containing protein
MGAKMSKKPLPTVKTVIEFAIIILAAIVLFLTVNSMGIFGTFCQSHAQHDKIMLAAILLATALAVFSFRRWLEVRRTHKELAESEEHIRFQAALLDEIGDSVLATDLNGKITYVNQAQCNWKNKTKDELLGQSVRVFDLDNSIEQVQQEIIRITREKGKWSGEIVSHTADGRKFIVECRTWLMKDKNDIPIGICGVTRDVTERKEQQQELSKHKRYLEALDKAAGILLNSISEIKYDEFLAALGPASDADRVHIFLKITDEKLNIPLRRKTQWCRNEKIPPVPTELTENRFFGKIFPEWQKTLATGKHICLCEENFPSEQIDFWESIHIKALLIVPIIIDNQLGGFMSFDNCTEIRQWTESEIEFLHTAANNLAITIKRFEIKKELKEQRDFAQKLIETAQTIVLLLDKNANIITFNPYFEKLTGYRLDEIKGKNWFDTFLPEEDRQKIKNIFAKAITNTSTKGNINPIVTKDGRLRYVEWFDKTLKDESGQTTGLLSTGQDITERLKAEEELKNSENMFKGIATAVPVGLGIAANRTIQWINDYLMQLLGYPKEEIIGSNSRMFYENDEGYNLIGSQYYRELRETGRSEIEVNWKRKDGRILNIFLTGVPLDRQDISRGIIFAVLDITERKQAEEELKEAHSELEQRVIQRTAALQQVNTQLLKTIEEKDRIQKILQETEKLAGAGKLAAQIAHEINNPIAGIKNSFLLLKDAIPSDYKYFEYVGRIEKEIERVSHIVQQMFDLYRPGTRPADNFNVYEVISDIAELLRTASKEKWIHIETSCPDDIIVMLPEALFRQVMYNIVQNAIQASPPKGTVKITVSKGDSKLKIQVSDEGPGIDEGIKHKIFEPFFTTGTGGPGSGLGLGLSITKDIINAMEGKIHFENRSPKGTVFTISIPITNESRTF